MGVKHCWQKVEIIRPATKWEKGSFRYRCKQCGAEFICSNAGKITSADWLNKPRIRPSGGPFGYGLLPDYEPIAEDCSEQLVRMVSES